MTGPTSGPPPEKSGPQQPPELLGPWAATVQEAQTWRATIAALRGADTTPPSWARVLNALRGGDDYLPVDIECLDHTVAVQALTDIAKAGLDFRNRVVWHLVNTCHIRQLLVIGTDLRVSGFPDVHHEADLHPSSLLAPSRVLYIDDDPFVLDKTRTRLAEDIPGEWHIRWGAVEDPRQIVRAAADTLDLTRPVGVLIPHAERYDDTTLSRLIEELACQLAPGSHLALAGITGMEHGPLLREAALTMTPLPLVVRDPIHILALFGSWEPQAPRLWPCQMWRPSNATDEMFTAAELMEALDGQPPADVWGGVAVLPGGWPPVWRNYNRQIKATAAAQLLGVDTDTVRRWAAAGYLRWMPAGGQAGAWVYHRDDVQALADRIAGYRWPTLRLLKRLLPPGHSVWSDVAARSGRSDRHPAVGSVRALEPCHGNQRAGHVPRRLHETLGQPG